MSRILVSAVLVPLLLVSTACGERAGAGFGDEDTANLPPEVEAAREVPPSAQSAARAAADRNLRESGAAADAAGEIPMPDQAQAPAPEAVVPSMIIRTGRARIEVDSLEVAVEQVRALAARLGGYVANSSIQAGDERLREGMLELKIPAERFDAAVNGLAAIGEVEEVTVDAQDVGEEFVDVTARLDNARRLEERLIELLAQRTGELDDVLMVERELARVRERIERYQGRLRYLESRVAVSTLTVNVHEPPPLVGDRPGTNVIGDAFRQAWRNFVGLVAAVIASLGIVIPVAVVVVAAWLLGWRAYQRRRGLARKQE